MAAQNSHVRQIERKYRNLKRKSKWDVYKNKLPFLIAGGLLLLTAVIAVWILTHPNITPPDDRSLRIYVLDIGQGDAVLLQTKEHAVLIDGGEAEEGYLVLQMLKALHISQLDAVINSHPHSDHIGGLQTVLAHMPVQKLIMPDIPDLLIPISGSYLHVLEAAQASCIPVSVPACGDTLSFGCAELEFLSTDNTQFDDLNNCSLGCRVTCGDVSMFLAGDLEKDGEAAFLADGLLAPVTILKVSHHGSSSSSGEEFLTALKPEYAAISCGALNDYGHPSAKCLDRLTAAGCTVFRTDLDGTILFETDGKTVQTRTDFDFGF